MVFSHLNAMKHLEDQTYMYIYKYAATVCFPPPTPPPTRGWVLKGK